MYRSQARDVLAANLAGGPAGFDQAHLQVVVVKMMFLGRAPRRVAWRSAPFKARCTYSATSLAPTLRNAEGGSRYVEQYFGGPFPKVFWRRHRKLRSVGYRLRRLLHQLEHVMLVIKRPLSEARKETFPKKQIALDRAYARCDIS